MIFIFKLVLIKTSQIRFQKLKSRNCISHKTYSNCFIYKID